MSAAATTASVVDPLPLDAASRIARFQSFLRIPTVANEGNRNGANERAIDFLRGIGENIGLQATVVEYAAHRPILLLTLVGQRPDLQSILLNSHYDVVPVMREHWKVDPFAAEMDEKGDIYGRGTQDMKSVCMQYLEAMHNLIRTHETNGGAAATGHRSPFLRTIHLSFQPDEETGGEFGMQKWTETSEFRALNVGFALDEGIANPADEFTVFFGERGVWWMMVKAVGPTGHGSRFIKDPATMKLMRSVQKFLEFRDAQEQKLLHGQASTHAECGHAMSKKLELGDVITINLTVLKAGVSVDGGATYSMNVVPMEAEAGFDVRLPPHVDLEEFETRIKEWTAEDGMSYSIRKFSAEYVTRLDEERNPFWKTFKATLEAPRTRADGTQSATKVAPQIFPAGTDSRFLRRAGIPVIGFSPLRLTPVLLHDHNERLNKAIYLDGIDVYTSLIAQLANQPIEMTTNEDGVYRETKQPLDRVEQKVAPVAAAPAL